MKDFKTRDAQAPCQDCVIVWMKAGLEFLDGRAASVAEGMWLHHTVLNNEANTALHNCDKARRRQRFFASGNEMSIVDLSGNGYAVHVIILLLTSLLRRAEHTTRLIDTSWLI